MGTSPAAAALRASTRAGRIRASAGKLKRGRLLWIMKLFASPLLIAAVCLGFAVAPSGLLAQAKPSGRAVGPVVAKVRIDLFSDFQCPSCKGLAEGTLRRLKEEY